MNIPYQIYSPFHFLQGIRKRLLCVALAFSLALLYSGCSSGQSNFTNASSSSYEILPPSPSSMKDMEPEEILLSADRLELSPGETFSLSYSLLPKGSSPLDTVYSCSDSTVATVSEDGVITALSAGTATITITLENNVSASLSLLVRSPYIPVSSMNANTDSVTLSIGQEKNLSVTMYPENATDKEERWSSSDPDIATVDSSGNIYAVASGHCIVTVSSVSTPGVSCDISVTVTSPSSSSRSSNPSRQKVNSGDFSSWNQSCDWYMTVINSNNPISDEYKPPLASYQSIQIDERVLPHLQEMMKAASSDGAGLWLASGYRDIALQTKLYNRKVNYFLDRGYSEENALVEAATIVAKPRTSEHHTGLAVDFNNVADDFRDTKGYRWLTEHAAEYGFIERYPSGKQDITNVIYEPWHFRYVGVENAKAIQESGLCLEEYVRTLS